MIIVSPLLALPLLQQVNWSVLYISMVLCQIDLKVGRNVVLTCSNTMGIDVFNLGCVTYAMFQINLKSTSGSNVPDGMVSKF